MEIENLKLKDILNLCSALQPKCVGETTATAVENSVGTVNAESFWRIGKNYFIRTVTHHHAGVLVAVGEHEIVLTKAAWIADDGRLTQSLANAEFNEVEMFPSGANVLIGRGSIIDAVEISAIPTSQK